ncbi:hypothetical protein A3A84_02635 [Candidatus Collierbacteria bacterium RIFCSPLOWO2_01_FULL_50_23]|uniref:Uncharacterized protein n=1 Tax=Candidatus Collierbacteria bacterium RIFCSPHIGHO2_01_FULL_50_25 TaxID=1817722 RepID=A0A1F5EXN0_9BACT|nr:MAG: hypothetical protein A2703_02000 [Candidatus Collierbacteria bacterium RIFCSPHIGHO2_01_FULL_50_25]OGD73698.1 MAG: hypothetical protein A3A84_02635 [Candidatus Collierbacteria bacterium RIFCSPLOWO2_01_FULL_50_23]
MKKNSPLFIDIGQGLFIMIDLLKIPTWANLDRPKKAKKGTLGFNSQTNSLEYWSGSVWFAAAMNEG